MFWWDVFVTQQRRPVAVFRRVFLFFNRLNRWSPADCLMWGPRHDVAFFLVELPMIVMIKICEHEASSVIFALPLPCCNNKHRANKQFSEIPNLVNLVT